MRKGYSEGVGNEIPEFTQEEIQAAIDKLKKKGKQVTTMESGSRTSRTATQRRKK